MKIIPISRHPGFHGVRRKDATWLVDYWKLRTAELVQMGLLDSALEVKMCARELEFILNLSTEGKNRHYLIYEKV